MLLLKNPNAQKEDTTPGCLVFVTVMLNEVFEITEERPEKVHWRGIDLETMKPWPQSC